MLTLNRIIGPMLGAEIIHVHGVVVVSHYAHEPVTREFWADQRGCWRDEGSDGITHITSVQGSATLHEGRVLESSHVRLTSGFHAADKLIRPLNAPIWGRPSDDWRLGDTIDVVTIDGTELAHIDLVETAGANSRPGYVRVDPSTGRIWDLRTPARRWQLSWIEDYFEPDPNRFTVPGTDHTASVVDHPETPPSIRRRSRS